MAKPVRPVLCFLVVLLAGVGCAQPTESSYCERLDEMKLMPYKISPGDEIYYGIIGEGQGAVECLLERMMDTQYMTDPRQAPPYGGFTVGDAAFMVLLDICDLSFDEMMPEEVRAKLDDQGVYAYFAYVEEGLENRQRLADAMRAAGCR